LGISGAPINCARSENRQPFNGFSDRHSATEHQPSAEVDTFKSSSVNLLWNNSSLINRSQEGRFTPARVAKPATSDGLLNSQNDVEGMSLERG